MLKLLAIDSSAKSVSAAVLRDNRILAESYCNNGLTHSKTLLPLITEVIERSGISLEDIDMYACNVGPGSFTGIRIGVATVKGLASVNNTLCCGISTLESIAYNFLDTDCRIASVMDARCNQVYNAVFDIKDGKVSRITDDRAISIDDLESELSKYDGKVILAGDGSDLCYSKMNLDNVFLSSEYSRFQRASGVGLCAADSVGINPSLLVPVYLRPPQAERELKIKKEVK